MRLNARVLKGRVKIKILLLVFCGTLSLSLLLVDLKVLRNPSFKTTSEMYSPKLERITSLDAAEVYIDSLISLTGTDLKDTASLVACVSSFTKQRFYHGLSRYSIGDNWIAALSGKLCWDHFSAIVDPKDVLKHNEGLCSQQAIVFMELLHRRGIKTRSVGLGYKEGPGHFITEVLFDGQWHLYDVNKEPKWEKIQNHHKGIDYYMQNKDTLYSVYQDQMDRKAFMKIMEKVEYGKVDEFPAKKMLLFHRVTKVVTYILPFLFFLLAFRSYIRSPKGKLKTTTIETVGVNEQSVI